MKTQRVVAANCKPVAISAKPAFRASISHRQPPDHLAYKDLIRTLGTDFETSPSTWRRAVDHSAETVIFYQVDLRGDVPRMSKSVRICREEGPGKKVSGAKYLVPSVYVGDMLLEYAYVMGIIGQRYLEDEDDLMKLLEHADLLYAADAIENEDDEEMVDGSDGQVEEEDEFPARAKAKIGEVNEILKSTRTQRSTKLIIRDEKGKAAKKRRNGSAGSDDAASASVKTSDIVPVSRSQKTPANSVKVQKKRAVDQEEDLAVSEPEYSGPEPKRSKSDEKRRTFLSRSATAQRSTRSGTLRPTPPVEDVVLLDSGNPSDESSPVSYLPAENGDSIMALGHHKKKSGHSGRHANTVVDITMDGEQANEPASIEDDRTCPQCKGKFYSVNGRDRHVREIHQNLGRTPCPECDKPIRERHLAKHLQTHKSGKKMRHIGDNKREPSDSL